jgi:hypothetical protein
MLKQIIYFFIIHNYFPELILKREIVERKKADIAYCKGYKIKIKVIINMRR